MGCEIKFGIRHESYLAWEKHNQEPEVWRWRQIVNFLGYNPQPAPASLPEEDRRVPTPYRINAS